MSFAEQLAARAAAKKSRPTAGTPGGPAPDEGTSFSSAIRARQLQHASSASSSGSAGPAAASARSDDRTGAGGGAVPRPGGKPEDGRDKSSFGSRISSSATQLREKRREGAADGVPAAAVRSPAPSGREPARGAASDERHSGVLVSRQTSDASGAETRSSPGPDEDKDVIISQLRNKLLAMEVNLAETTELKNAEIDVLRKQLNRAERSNATREETMRDREGRRNESWKAEREGFREEIRRLNLEVSNLRSQNRTASDRNSVLDETDEHVRQYASGIDSDESPPSRPRNAAGDDDSDVASLQSIIAMMRQTIEQANGERSELERRLREEQERSQAELNAFVRTLEGVDDLRQSAEAMSREIRRIKVKGYRPTRSDLLGGSSGGAVAGGGRSYGELTAAVEASESMEAAIQLIESQNDALEERRRAGVVSSTAAESSSANVPVASKGGRVGMRPISEDGDGGFLSFWNRAGDDEKTGREEGAGERKEKKKKSKKKRRDREDGSVLTSFF